MKHLLFCTARIIDENVLFAFFFVRSLLWLIVYCFCLHLYRLFFLHFCFFLRIYL